MFKEFGKNDIMKLSEGICLENIRQKIDSANEILKNSDRLLEHLVESIRKRLSIDNKYISILNKINIDVDYSNHKYYSYMDQNFSDYRNVLTLREKMFIVQYVENIGIDFTEEEKYKLLDLMGKELFRQVHYDYAVELDRLSYEFDMSRWNKLLADYNFLDFYTTVHFSKDDTQKEHPFMAFCHHDILNVFGILAYVMKSNVSLKTRFEELMQSIIEYSGNRQSYPFDVYYGDHRFMTEYFKDRILSVQEKQFILRVRAEHADDFFVIILESNSFSQEEKKAVIDSIDYTQFMNNFLYEQVFSLKDCLQNGYEIIDVPRLLMMDSDHLRRLLEKIIDENKVPKNYNPYYSFKQYGMYVFLNFSSESIIDLSQLKKDYIDNFVASIEFYKKANCLQPITNKVGIIRVGDQYGEQHLETEFIDAIRSGNNTNDRLSQKLLMKLFKK